MSDSKTPDKVLIDRFEEPLSFILGSKKVIRGFEIGVEGLAVGEEAIIFVPSKLAYGKVGQPPLVMNDTDLLFKVCVNEVSDDKSPGSNSAMLSDE